MPIKPLPPIEFLRECFSYDPITGMFRWNARPRSHFSTDAHFRSWNTRYAGRQTFVSADNDGYLRCEVVYGGLRFRLRASRVAVRMATGDEPIMVDHVNGNVADNRLVNLRPADDRSNQWNRTQCRTHALPKCVSFEKGKFVARVSLNGRKRRLGSFSTPAEAHAAYCAAVAPLHGEFFNPGYPKPSVFD